MIIPGFVISILTFPGVIVHEIAHRFFCDIVKVSVYRVCYFRVGNPAGYVSHADPKSLKKSFLISIGPLLINTILCAITTLPVSFSMYILKTEPTALMYVLGWLGISIGMHAFPSTEDMENFAASAKNANRKGILYFVAYPFMSLVAIANVARIFWFDLFYAVGVAVILPLIIFYI